jgi:hypothetical protein
LIQITLQITSTPENDTTGFKLNQASSVRCHLMRSIYHLS